MLMLLALVPLALAGPRVDALEARLRAQEQELVALRARMGHLEAELRAMSQARIDWGAMVPIERDPQTGALRRVLDQAHVLACVRATIDGVRTSQLSFDAAFDRFEPDLDAAGWGFDPGTGCGDWMAVSMPEVLPTDFRVELVVTRGPERGRHFTGNKDGQARELERLDEAGVVALLARRRWWGYAR